MTLFEFQGKSKKKPVQTRMFSRPENQPTRHTRSVATYGTSSVLEMPSTNVSGYRIYHMKHPPSPPPRAGTWTFQTQPDIPSSSRQTRPWTTMSHRKRNITMYGGTSHARHSITETTITPLSYY